MNASYYFWLLIGITIGLFIIALFIPKLQKNKEKTLSELYQLCQAIETLNEYQVIHNNKYISLSKHNQKIALLTLDDKLGNHTRKMGDSLIVNFNSLPNKKALEQRLIQDKIIMVN